MKKIELTKRQHVMVDDEDFDWLNQWKWYTLVNRRKKYAVRRPTTGVILMHRLIMNTPDGMVVDHINGNGLDNQKVNLRNCTDGENKRNRNMPRGNTSGLKGVSWSKQNKKWDARISTNNKQICLGTFSNKEDAYRAYVDACQKYHGNFAKYD